MEPKISTSGSASIKWIEWEQEAEEGSNPNRPGKEYADVAREIVLHYYKVQSMQMLQREFLDAGVDGFLSLCADIGREIMDKLEDTELYNNWADYVEHI